MGIQTHGCRRIIWRLVLSGALVFLGAFAPCRVQAQNRASALGETSFLRRENELGFKAIDAARFSEALAHFNRVLAKAPHDVEALYGRGWTYSQLHQHQLAMKDYSQGIQLQPDNAELYVGRAFARHGAGDYNGLVADMEKATALDSENQPLLDDARSTRLFAWVKLFFAGLAGLLLLVGAIPLVRVVRLMMQADAAAKSNA